MNRTVAAVLIVLVIVVLGLAYVFKGRPIPLNTPAPAKGVAAPAKAATPAPKNHGPEDIDAAVKKAVEWLKEEQNADGGWGLHGHPSDPGITGLVIKGLVACGVRPEDNPWLQKAVDMLLGYQHEDGSFYLKSLQSYVTAIAVTALAAIDRKKYAPQIEKAKEYLLSIQFKPGGPRTKEKWYVGGITYNDEQKPPNLSTTVYALEALRAAGVPKDSQAYKLALKFISRCQNRSESNDIPLDVLLTNDGGFFYMPGDTRGEVVKNPDGTRTLRSYGSMTYAGLLGMLYCYATMDDPRVKSALEWVQKHYTFDHNPGMPKPRQGHYYYLQTIAKVIDTAGMKELPDGKPIMKDLLATILRFQKPEGFWVNEDEARWWEGDPIIPTAHMLVALGHIKHLMQR
ncbi:MAG: hypothetical protein DRP90_03905 [Planctomycetota bacterium]|nr:MAG: hypothetical protein DRP90_03905 [Planctomycetota bacterium]